MIMDFLILFLFVILSFSKNNRINSGVMFVKQNVNEALISLVIPFSNKGKKLSILMLGINPIIDIDRKSIVIIDSSIAVLDTTSIPLYTAYKITKVIAI